MIVFTVIGAIVSALIAAVAAFWLFSWGMAWLTREHKLYIPKGVKPQKDTTSAYANPASVSTDR